MVLHHRIHKMNRPMQKLARRQPAIHRAADPLKLRPSRLLQNPRRLIRQRVRHRVQSRLVFAVAHHLVAVIKSPRNVRLKSNAPGRLPNLPPHIHPRPIRPRAAPNQKDSHHSPCQRLGHPTQTRPIMRPRRFNNHWLRRKDGRGLVHGQFLHLVNVIGLTGHSTQPQFAPAVAMESAPILNR